MLTVRCRPNQIGRNNCSDTVIEHTHVETAVIIGLSQRRPDRLFDQGVVIRLLLIEHTNYGRERLQYQISSRTSDGWPFHRFLARQLGTTIRFSFPTGVHPCLIFLLFIYILRISLIALSVVCRAQRAIRSSSKGSLFP